MPSRLRGNPGGGEGWPTYGCDFGFSVNLPVANYTPNLCDFFIFFLGGQYFFFKIPYLWTFFYFFFKNSRFLGWFLLFCVNFYSIFGVFFFCKTSVICEAWWYFWVKKHFFFLAKLQFSWAWVLLFLLFWSIFCHLSMQNLSFVWRREVFLSKIRQFFKWKTSFFEGLDALYV